MHVPRRLRYWSTVGPKGGGFTRNGASDRGVRLRPSYSYWRQILWPSARSSYVSGIYCRFPDHGPSWGHSFATIRRHDTTLFLHGATVTAHHVSTMMGIFLDFSGLQLNRGKYSVVGIKLSSEELDRVSSVLATPVTPLPIICLGLLLEGRLRSHDW